MDALAVGSRIQVRRTHWARARCTGEVLEVLPTGRLVVRFDKRGIGYDEGWKLELGEDDLEPIE